MPESFNDYATPPGAPAKLGGAQGATNADPSSNGKAAGGLKDSRARAAATGATTFRADDSRAETSPLRPSSAPQHIGDGTCV